MSRSSIFVRHVVSCASFAAFARVSIVSSGLSLLAGGCRDSVSARTTVEEAVSPRLSRAAVLATAVVDLPADDGGADGAPAESALAPGWGAAWQGPLENIAALTHVFEALAELDGGQAHADVTVLHFGDSHTAADFETGPLRRALQARFGDGGRGFVAIGEPWKHYVQEGLRNGSSRDWTAERARPSTRERLDADGLYGLAGVALHADRPGARAWGDYLAKASRIELAYLAQPSGGSFDVLIDGARADHISTRALVAQSAWRPFAVNDGPHRVEIVASGDGDVRLFGADLDRDRAGIVYDALGINGARVTGPLSWNEAHLGEQIRHRSPDLVVLAYGTNESSDTDVPIEVYEQQIVNLLGRVERAVPSASCMLIGPPDRAVHTREGWGTLPRLVEIVEAQRRVARAAGCAFFDQLAAMGGPGSIAQWADEPQPRAGRDRVHLTREGYAQLGTLIASELIRGYTFWQAASAPVEPSNPFNSSNLNGAVLPPLPGVAAPRVAAP